MSFSLWRHYMPPKKKTTAPPEPDVSQLKMLDLTLKDEDTGAELVVVANPADIEEVIRIYSMQLQSARGVPPSDEIATGDPIFAYIYEQLYQGKPPKDAEEEDRRLTRVTRETSNYYKLQREYITGEATVLAITVNNSFTNEPVPYPPPEIRKLPGILELPPPEKRIDEDLAEYRLKQLIDYLEANPNLGLQFISLRNAMQERITMTLLDSVSVAGFR